MVKNSFELLDVQKLFLKLHSYGVSGVVLKWLQNFFTGRTLQTTRSSADADNGLDAFRSQSRSTNMVPFWVHCDFSLSM